MAFPNQLIPRFLSSHISSHWTPTASTGFLFSLLWYLKPDQMSPKSANSGNYY